MAPDSNNVVLDRPQNQPLKETTKEMMTRMMSDSRMDQAELQELAVRYEAEKENIQEETKSQVDTLLKSTVTSMLNGGGVELNKVNITVLQKYLGDIPQDIQDRIKNGEVLTLITKESKLIEKTFFDTLGRGLNNGTSISAKESASLWKESAQKGFAKLSVADKDTYKSLITTVAQNPDLGASGSYADQALNMALGNTSVETGIKITNIKDEADRKAVVDVLNAVMVQAAAAAKAPTSTEAAASVTSVKNSNETKASTVVLTQAPTQTAAPNQAPENIAIDTTSLEVFFKSYQHHGDNFGKELQKNQEALKTVKTILKLEDRATYKEVQEATITLQKNLQMKPADGAFGPNTLAAYKKAPAPTPTEAPTSVPSPVSAPTPNSNSHTLSA